MKTWITLLVAASAVPAASAATAFCEDICEVPLGRNCADAIAQLEFEGTCCSLKAVGGECIMITTSDCHFQVKGDTGCITDADGNLACVVPGTLWGSDSNETCPDSEFEIPPPTDPLGDGIPAETDAQGDAASNDPETIWDLASTISSLSQFTRALELADLDVAVDSPGPITVFAPVDSAFNALPYKLWEPAWKLHLTNFLMYHVVPLQEVLTTDVTVGELLPTSLWGENIEVTSVDPQVVLNDNARFITKDVPASNGILHAIDTLLLPSFVTTTVGQALRANPDLTRFVELLDENALMGPLMDMPGPFTVLAPDNAAFDKFPISAILDSMAKRLEILKYHILPNLFVAEEVMVEGGTFDTLQGADVKVEMDEDGELLLDGDASITTPDVLVNNGIIHITDYVLIPVIETEGPSTVSEPTEAPVTNTTTQAPVMTPTEPPVAPTSIAPVSPPTGAPAANATEPTESPTVGSTEAPPTNATTEAPTEESPLTDATTEAPTEESPPTDATTEAPTESPPTNATTEAPTESPPTNATTEAPAQNRTAPTTDPVAEPTQAPQSLAPTKAAAPTTQAPTSTQSISEILSTRTDTIILAQALNVSSYYGIWNADRARTVFAPTDWAFLFAPVNMTKYMSTEQWGRTHMWSLFKYLSTMGTELSSDWMDGDVLVNFEGENLTVAIEPEANYFINGAAVEEADIDATNGVIHLMEEVILPMWAETSLADVVLETPELASLALALTGEELLLLQEHNGPFTLLAPTDVDMTTLLPDANLLLSHLIPGIITRVSPGENYTTLQGSTIQIVSEGTISSIRTNETTLAYISPEGDTVAQMEFQTIDGGEAELVSNGIVHQIGTVLLPTTP